MGYWEHMLFVGHESGLLRIWLLRVSASRLMSKVRFAYAGTLAPWYVHKAYAPPLMQNPPCVAFLRHSLAAHAHTPVVSCSVAPSAMLAAMVSLTSGSLFCTVGADNTVAVFSLQAAPVQQRYARYRCWFAVFPHSLAVCVCMWLCAYVAVCGCVCMWLCVCVAVCVGDPPAHRVGTGVRLCLDVWLP